MKSRRLFLFSILFCFIVTAVSAQKQFMLKAPGGKLEANITIGKAVEYTVFHDSVLMLDKSAIAMTLADGTAYGVNPKLSGSSVKTVNRIIESPIYKRKQIVDNYNELTLRFKGDYSIIFRAYDDGIAYRFVSASKKPFIVENEKAEFNFPEDENIIMAYANKPEGTFESQYMNSFEQTYNYIRLSQWNKKRLGISPLVVEREHYRKKVCLVEADLLNYPGMFLYPSDVANGLKGVFAPYPKEVKQGGYNELQGMVSSREPYIAKFDGATNFPWRAVIVSENDSQLADNDMVYKLSTPSQGDFSWVKPGKVAWDWWNAWNLYNVDFRTGVNNDTYKYYIDFASKYGIEYIILDEGWSVNKKADLFQVVPDINLKELVDYGKSKNVGLILWAGYYAFNRDMEKVCKHYHEMGVKGFKVDFMDRDDQLMVDFHRRAGEMGAKYQLLIDFHGTYKPTGLQRTYPNVINFEGVSGLENMKWSPVERDQVTYDVTIPFVRQVAGPMDYTQGAMRNASKENYRPVYSEAMSQGTRCRQLAEYIIFESPLNMLCDSPSNYMNEDECTKFIAGVPTVWDNTIALDGKIAEYIAIARQKEDVWYVGALNNWDARKMELDLSFLGKGNFTGEVFRDGINAGRAGRDYKKETITIPANRKLPIYMAQGGGYVVKITKAYNDGFVAYAPVKLTGEEKQAIRQSVEKLNERYDPKGKMLTTKFDRWNYHTDATSGVFHEVRASFNYALDLLDLGDEQYRQRAFDIIEKTVSLQDTDPQSRSCGVWPYHEEEPLATKKSPIDYNWADFNAVTLLDIYMSYKDEIPVALSAKIENAIILAAKSIQKRNVGPDYTNIAIMGTYVTLMISHLFDIQDMKTYAIGRLKRFYDYTLEKNGFQEYNSPTYTIVALDELQRMKQHIVEPEAKTIIDRLYYIGWEIIAKHYHKPTAQWAGPHSRSYSTLIASSFYQLLNSASEGKIDLGYKGSDIRLKHHIPEELLPYFLTPSYPRIQRDIFENSEPQRIGTCYLTERYALSSVNRASLWNQRRPFLAYWGTAEKPSYLQVRFLHDLYDLSAAIFFSEQKDNTILSAINFVPNLGDKHIVLDMLKDGKFMAKDLRLRFEFGNTDMNQLAIPAHKNAPITFNLDDITFNINLFYGVFGKYKGYWEKGGDGNTTWIDYVLYSGNETEIDLNAIDEAALGFSFCIAAAGDKCLEKDVKFSVENGVLNAEWNGMKIDIPVKPEKRPNKNL